MGVNFLVKEITCPDWDTPFVLTDVETWESDPMINIELYVVEC